MGLDRLIGVMRRLRDPVDGCEWDKAQTLSSLAPYAIEEAYEVADAISRNDMPALADELGDLQLQVVFHAAIAEQAGIFTLADIMAGIADKLERRHPHIFGDGDNLGWEALKRQERTARGVDRSALADVPASAPALMRAHKLQVRAALTGFDWPDAAGARAKVLEELDEVDAAQSHEERVDEVGDLLFAVVNLARKHEVVAEDALRQATAKFEARFRHMETEDPDLARRSADEQEALWLRAKAALSPVVTGHEGAR